MQYSFSKLSSPGGRQCNEDSVQVIEMGNKFLAVIADGLGGVGGGDVASHTATSSVLDYFTSSADDPSQSIITAISKANDAVLSAQTSGEHMKTTITVLCVENQNAVCGHLGDSRLYQFRNGEIIFQTQDHSVSQMAV